MKHAIDTYILQTTLKKIKKIKNTVAVKTIHMNPKVNEGPMREMQRGGRDKEMCAREKSINHSYAPVRVVSGTKRKHMQLYNISRPPASRTGSLKPSPLHHLAVP